MKKIRFSAMIIAVLMVVACSTASIAQMRGMGPGGMIPLRVLMDLDLTDAQKAEIAAIVETSQTDREMVREKHQQIKSIMTPVLTADVFNEENIRAACAAVSPLMEDIMVVKAKIANQIKSVLTEAQRQIMKEKREEGMKKMEKFAEIQKTMLKAWLDQAASE